MHAKGFGRGKQVGIRMLCAFSYMLFRVFTPDLKGDLPPYEKLQELTYTHNVLKEALRKYYIVPVVTRVAVEDDEIGGYKIPAATKVVIPILVCICAPLKQLLSLLTTSVVCTYKRGFVPRAQQIQTGEI